MEFHPTTPNTPAGSPTTQSYHKHPPSADRNGQKLKTLTPEQIKFFDENGVLVLKSKDMWSADELRLLLASVNLMNDWPDRAGHYMKYYEKKKANPSEKILSRVENFTQYNPGLDFLLNGDKLRNMVTDLFGEESILYKEKINYKLPGGDGFAPHQDVAAGWWMYNQTLHISCSVCIDPANMENGCLEVCNAAHRDGMLCDDWKEIPSDVVQKLNWYHVPCEPGDVIFFDSYVPHKSGPNESSKPRRVLYATYAKAAEGDFRDRYYADKRVSFPPDIERDAGKTYEYKI